MTNRFALHWLFPLVATVACFRGSYARQVPAPYTDMVDQATAGDKTNYAHAVYVWPWVKVPGAYPLKQGMTVADIIAAAGGLVTDNRMDLHWDVHTINVMRPSPDDPNPIGAVYCFSVDWTNSESNVSECKFLLQEGDLVTAGMGTCLTNCFGKGPPIRKPWEETYFIPQNAFPARGVYIPPADMPPSELPPFAKTYVQMQIPEIKFENLPLLQAIEYIQKLDRDRAVISGTNTTVIVNINRPQLVIPPDADEEMRREMNAMATKRLAFDRVAGIDTNQHVSFNDHGQTAGEALQALAGLYSFSCSTWRGAVVLGYPQIEARIYRVRPEIHGEPDLRLQSIYGRTKTVHLFDGHEFYVYPSTTVVKYLEAGRIVIGVGDEDSLLALQNLLKKSISR